MQVKRKRSAEMIPKAITERAFMLVQMMRTRVNILQLDSGTYVLVAHGWQIPVEATLLGYVDSNGNLTDITNTESISERD